MRYVARNRPFIVRNGATDWPARQKWNAAYLSSVMQTHSVNVALTPHGNADSVVRLAPPPSTPRGDPAIPEEEPLMMFVKPHETQVPFPAVLSRIRAPLSTRPTCYLQTQNDNLRSEYAPLFADVPPSIPFARIALARRPDAINFWLGNAASVTALHKDNYENIYVQVLGRKHFVLLPPVEAACVNERAVLAGTYRPRWRGGSGFRSHNNEADDGGDGSDELDKNDLVVAVDEPEEYVPFATWDPDAPAENATPFSQYSRPLRVTLNEGDMLYLPALWYHKVSQSCNNEGICCAVNYWYDLDFSGGFWSMAHFVRAVGLLSKKEKDKEAKLQSEKAKTLLDED